MEDSSENSWTYERDLIFCYTSENDLIRYNID